MDEIQQRQLLMDEMQQLVQHTASYRLQAIAAFISVLQVWEQQAPSVHLRVHPAEAPSPAPTPRLLEAASWTRPPTATATAATNTPSAHRPPTAASASCSPRQPQPRARLSLEVTTAGDPEGDTAPSAASARTMKQEERMGIFYLLCTNLRGSSANITTDNTMLAPLWT